MFSFEYFMLTAVLTIMISVNLERWWKIHFIFWIVLRILNNKRALGRMPQCREIQVVRFVFWNISQHWQFWQKQNKIENIVNIFYLSISINILFTCTHFEQWSVHYKLEQYLRPLLTASKTMNKSERTSLTFPIRPHNDQLEYERILIFTYTKDVNSCSELQRIV